MTQEQELAIIRPWAASLPEKYDYVYLFKTLDGVNYYDLHHKSLIGHKCGTPQLVSIINGKPVRLEIRDVISIITS
ncbi:MAG: hypothetical protein MJZ36_10560 [Bacteroidaceae bacterium]|nr:hypothetical protein [Bacteroidaceae bacterium]